MSRLAPPPADPGWAWFLDVDGTLLALAETPDAIIVDAALPRLLAAVHAATGGALALVSGRALADLDRRFDLPAVPRAGQHGLERRDSQGRVSRHATPPPARRHLLAVLQPLLRREPRLLLEDKGQSLALHYRQVPDMAEELRVLMQALVAELNAQDGLAGALMLLEGKCVLEIRPGGVGKGTAVAEFLAEAPFAGRRPVFVGDDRSDAHAFAEVNARGGISVGVGGQAQGARYHLPGPAEVRAWLAGMLSGPGR